MLLPIMPASSLFWPIMLEAVPSSQATVPLCQTFSFLLAHEFYLWLYSKHTVKGLLSSLICSLTFYFWYRHFCLLASGLLWHQKFFCSETLENSIFLFLKGRASYSNSGLIMIPILSHRPMCSRTTQVCLHLFIHCCWLWIALYPSRGRWS